jgi:hypothetical protein
MQGARRANIPAIFNRLGWAKPSGDHRATPQDGMHRFPNANVFVGRDTSTLSGAYLPEAQRARPADRHCDSGKKAAKPSCPTAPTARNPRPVSAMPHER